MNEQFRCKLVKYDFSYNDLEPDISYSLNCEYTSNTCTMTMNFSFNNISDERFSKLIQSMKSNSDYTIKFEPGSNQWAEISTKEGKTTFCLNGAGGADPVSFSFCIENSVCVEEFANITTVNSDCCNIDY